MERRAAYRDSLYRLAQIGDTHGMQLVRIAESAGGNRYDAQAVEFTADGTTALAEQRTFQVTNLAEDPASGGALSAGAETVALDVEGRWVVFLQQAQVGAGCFPAKVLSAMGGATYSVIEQSITSEDEFQNAAGATAVSAKNLAESTLGSGTAVDVGTIVLVAMLGSGATAKYVFDHPVYAKYLD